MVVTFVVVPPKFRPPSTRASASNVSPSQARSTMSYVSKLALLAQSGQLEFVQSPAFPFDRPGPELGR